MLSSTTARKLFFQKTGPSSLELAALGPLSPGAVPRDAGGWELMIFVPKGPPGGHLPASGSPVQAPEFHVSGRWCSLPPPLTSHASLLNPCAFSPSAFLGRECPTLSRLGSLFSECGQCPLLSVASWFPMRNRGEDEIQSLAF